VGGERPPCPPRNLGNVLGDHFLSPRPTPGPPPAWKSFFQWFVGGLQANVLSDLGGPGLDPPIATGRCSRRTSQCYWEMIVDPPLLLGDALGVPPSATGRCFEDTPIATGRSGGTLPIATGTCFEDPPLLLGDAPGDPPSATGRCFEDPPIATGRCFEDPPIATGRCPGGPSQYYWEVL